MTVLTWHDILKYEKKQPYFINILKNIAKERALGFTIYPPQKDIFNAFHFTKFSDIKIVILGQDPYHGPNQAHGLAFSVLPGISIPPSLFNIYKELKNNIPNFVIPNHGYLENWARQGVLLLNTTMTVRAGQAKSHTNLGWEIFVNKVITLINKYHKRVIFMLWGSHAHKKTIFIDKQRHLILQASHPSPLSAHYSFFGCNHFSIANQWLKRHGKIPIDWMPIIPKKHYNFLMKNH